MKLFWLRCVFVNYGYRVGFVKWFDMKLLLLLMLYEGVI